MAEGARCFRRRRHHRQRRPEGEHEWVERDVQHERHLQRHNLNATFGEAHGTDNGCGNTQVSEVPTVADPYAGLASNIPSDSCGGSYPQEPAKKKDPALPAANQWSGSYTLSSVKVVCGDQQLVGDTTINYSVLVIENGQLDTNGHTLSGSGLTVVFSGSNSSSSQHIPTGGGTLDIAPPTSGAWSGVAIYQDPSLTTNVDISYAGNSPTWNLTGLVYLPHSSATFSGAVNKSSHGQSCFTIVVDNITINGTGSIFANDTQCQSAGLAQPHGQGKGSSSIEANANGRRRLACASPSSATTAERRRSNSPPWR